MFEGKAMVLRRLESNIAELLLNARLSPVNVMSSSALSELSQVLDILELDESITGLLVTSGKTSFIAGADIKEFPELFAGPIDELQAWITNAQGLCNRLESLSFPSVSAINGVALGGGFEVALATDFRIMSECAKIGLPEVTLGICPGWGGSVRLTRLIGYEFALDWILYGKPKDAKGALEQGVADSVVPRERLRDEALYWLKRAIHDGNDEYQERRAKKQRLQDIAQNSRKEQRQRLGNSPTQPFTLDILDSVLSQANQPFDVALDIEADIFIRLARSDSARCLIGVFIAEQWLKNRAREISKNAAEVKHGAVIGAGLMGGGIAFQSAVSGVPVVMKDISESALELGIFTAAGLLQRMVDRGQIDPTAKENTLKVIKPTLSYYGLNKVDLVVEAVVENPAIKCGVLSEVEDKISEDTILTSNTSTISVDFLAEHLRRPEKFCGMHFFNPVHLMPLVEVVRGRASSAETISSAVSYALKMGKKPIVVKDCPGFLVNRVLFPYFNAFNSLLRDGVDFQRIDRIMEGFGWPMGPAYLADVIGLDTMVHADHVMQAGFPQRMCHSSSVFIESLLEQGFLGQKNGQGFYVYEGGKGRQERTPSDAAIKEAAKCTVAREVGDLEIVDRLMIPLCLESVRCLEEQIVETAAEIDMGIVLGLGFPRFRGGPLRYIDCLGLQEFAERVITYSHQGPLYQLTDGLLERLKSGILFHPKGIGV